jgi:hypothetical protein
LVVLSPRTPPLPVETVRDLLGLARALYRAWVAEGPSTAARRQRLRAIGYDLAKALDMAKKHEPGTLGHAGSWKKAERAAKELGELVDDYDGMKKAIAATAGGLRGARR